MKVSAGILLYRITNNSPEFFLVHPGGPFFTKKHEGWWTVPKGELLEGEEPLEAAVREFEEETGHKPEGPFTELTPIIQKGGKKVMCWACEGNLDADKIVSNTFETEWPPRSGARKTFPEVDKAGWFATDEAMQFVNERQSAFITELLAILK
ncbi:MAG: NUDIX domain-containing protein [Flavobacterium sp.]|nr:MAG: NUDIX domain-containing protein [Flavobacterium sp.]